MVTSTISGIYHHETNFASVKSFNNICLKNKVVRFAFHTLILPQNMSDGYISRQRIHTSFLKNEKTAFKLVVKLIRQNFFRQIDLHTV